MRSTSPTGGGIAGGAVYHRAATLGYMDGNMRGGYLHRDHPGHGSATGHMSCMRMMSKSGRRPKALTVLELVVVIAIIAGGLALMLPALDHSREVTRRTQCSQNLRHIGVGLHAIHEQREQLPVGVNVQPDGYTAYGWGVDLLAELDQAIAESEINRELALRYVSDSVTDNCSLAVYLCPSDIILPTFELRHEDWDEFQQRAERCEPDVLAELPTANYIGVFGTSDPHFASPDLRGDGAFVRGRGRRFREFERGLSETFIVGERTMARLPSTWLGTDLRAENGASRLVGGAFSAPNVVEDDECGFSSRHPGGANFLWGDGHVSFVSEDIDTQEYHNLARLRGVGQDDE